MMNAPENLARGFDISELPSNGNDGTYMKLTSPDRRRVEVNIDYPLETRSGNGLCPARGGGTDAGRRKLAARIIFTLSSDKVV